tara:strand:+ start:245 stop:367 length:123 start_codon:yes stop_codon:yes gene_type:complete
MEDNLTWKEKFFLENYKIDLRKAKRKLSSDEGDEDEKLIT